MTKIVVISVNENPQYKFYLPLVVWAWRKFGWQPLIFHTCDVGTLPLRWTDGGNYHRLVVPPAYGSDTVAQISRLYAASLYGHPDDYIMTSDVDMLPLSDYWKFDWNELTVWGHDLTGFQHVPICYVGMKRKMWSKVMKLSAPRNYNILIERDLDLMPNAKSPDSVKRWVVDQDLITERIEQSDYSKKFVPRGTLQNGYPFGRVDRSAWSIEHPQLIDCHMMRDIYRNPDNLAKTLLLLYKAFPGDDFTWFSEYALEFSKQNP